jgi:DNA-directed RNA polymerase
MVVPVDATCSGLQHYSAMLRDEVGGRSVNLVPGLSRQDIYQDVADVVIGQLLTDGSSMVQDWLAFGIDRKTTKRQVMVVPYAGTFASCMEYTRAAIEEKMKEGHLANWTSEDPSHTERVVYLSKLIWAAIDQVVIKGKEAMRWLSKTASEYTKLVNSREGTAYEKRMSWVTPDGFEAVHYRIEEKKKQVKSYLDGRVDLTYYDETPNLDPKGMALAVAPNFVHSMDACLLRMAVMKGLGEGITDFAMIHDSFGVHAHDMARFLSSCIKPAFVEMYQTDPLQEFAARLPLENLELDPLPSKGKLVLEDVVNSEFFFS